MQNTSHLNTYYLYEIKRSKIDDLKLLEQLFYLFLNYLF